MHCQRLVHDLGIPASSLRVAITLFFFFFLKTTMKAGFRKFMSRPVSVSRIVRGKDRQTYAQAEVDYCSDAGLLMQCSSSSIDAAAKSLYKEKRSTDTDTHRHRSARMKGEKRREGGR